MQELDASDMEAMIRGGFSPAVTGASAESGKPNPPPNV